jgi:hypothetical protein
MEAENMDIFRILWDEPDDPDGNVQHIAEHGLTIEDVEEVLSNPPVKARALPRVGRVSGATRLRASTLLSSTTKSIRTPFGS